jgi:hypothetical protein
MKEKINEEVSVVMYYSARKKQALPHLIHWQNRDYQVGEIGYCHSYMGGQERQHIFEVVDSSKSLFFRLRLDGLNLHWTLEAIHDGSAV